MFPIAGIAPRFFTKLMLFMAAINAGLCHIVIIAVLTTAVGAAYYHRIIKVMYFDEPLVSEGERPYDRLVSRETALILTAAAAINIFFFIYPSPLVIKAEELASVVTER